MEKGEAEMHHSRRGCYSIVIVGAVPRLCQHSAWAGWSAGVSWGRRGRLRLTPSRRSADSPRWSARKWRTLPRKPLIVRTRSTYICQISPMLNVQLISASCKEISEDSEPCGAGISYQEGGAGPQERRSRVQICGGSQSRNLLVTDVQHLLLETRLPGVQLEDLLGLNVLWASVD